MIAEQFDLQLANRLKDPTGAQYTPELRASALTAACRAYTQWFPGMRRLGTGNFLQLARAGQNQATIVGGLFAPGDTIYLEPNTPFYEPLVISTIGPATLGTFAAIGYALQVTFTTNLGFDHQAGAFLSEQVPGYTLVAGIDTYPLPLDFITMEQESWDLAIGIRSVITKYDAYYSALYVFSSLLSQSNFGNNQGYGPMFGFGFYGFYEGANNTANSSSLFGDQLLIRFLKMGNPQMVMTPAPSGTQLLDPVYYYCQRNPATIPDEDMEDLMLYATWVSLTGEAAFWASKPQYSQSDISKQPGTMVGAAAELAAAVLERWDLRTRQIPIIVSG